MNNLYAGFCRINVTPMMGISLSGYFQKRLADAVLDKLEINALVLKCKEEQVVLVSLDSLYMKAEIPVTVQALQSR